MDIMEYGYEKKDHRGNLVYPMYPVQEEEAIFYAAFIVGNGYIPVSSVTYKSEEKCRKFNVKVDNTTLDRLKILIQK